MGGTSERSATARPDPAALQSAWCERVFSDARLGDRVSDLFATDDGALDTVVTSVVERTRASADEPLDGGGIEEARAALATGRAAFGLDVDLPALQRLFGHLHDVLSGELLRGSTDADGTLCPRRAVRAARVARAAMERPVTEATRGWFDEAGRKLRHDVKTPLQATSLNLELLALEASERGLDTEALDTIQRSLDRVTELLARAEPSEG